MNKMNWIERLFRRCGFVPVAEAEKIARAGLNDAVMAQVERDRALRKSRALTILAEDAINCFQGKGAIVTEERLKNWRKRLNKNREPKGKDCAAEGQSSPFRN